MINVAQWFQFAMLESNKLYKEEMVVHSGWVVAREKLSHTGCPPIPTTPPNPVPVNLPDANRTGCVGFCGSYTTEILHCNTCMFLEYAGLALLPSQEPFLNLY